MTRGGRQKEREGPQRRCVATGESGPTEGMIRFVIDPEDRVTPDLAGKLPGRGVWIGARREHQLLARLGVDHQDREPRARGVVRLHRLPRALVGLGALGRLRELADDFSRLNINPVKRIASGQ